MNIDEMKDRIARAEEIQRYTENRCEVLEKENAELKADFIKSCKVKEQGFREAEQALERKDDQLTKAKEIIKTYYEDNFDEAEFYSLRKKAEQFLKGE